MIQLINKVFSNDQEMLFKVKLNFNISLSVFLFFLFFRPFGVTYSNINNLIIFFLGYGGITFIHTALFYILFPKIFPKFLKTSEWEAGPPNIICILILVFNTVAFVFYLRYVGFITISFYIVFRIIFICLLPIVALKIIHKNKFLERQLELLLAKIKNQNSNLPYEIKENYIELFSENKSDKIKLKENNLLLVKSADNYVEIIYKDNEKISKKLMRNTLKNIEIQLIDSEIFIRCHRTFIVNTNHIQKLSKDYKGDKLILHEYLEEIPVSRHYLLKVRESLNKH